MNRLVSSSGRWCAFRLLNVHSISRQHFHSLGVSTSITRQLNKAFPHIQSPTPCQEELIPALLAGKDVFVKDETGTGKSFGVLLAILSKYSSTDATSAPGCLFIVPHRDLAVQLYQWGQQLCASVSSKPVGSLIQLKSRGLNGMTTEDQASLLANNPPNIVIGTVGGLLDILENDAVLHQLRKVKTIVVDEADCLLDLPRKHAPRVEWKKFNRHPPQLTSLFAKLAGTPQREGGQGTKVQLVISSATMPSRIKGYIYAHSDSLFTRGEAHQVNLVARDAKPSVPARIDHYVVVALPDGTTVDLAEYEEAKGEEIKDGFQMSHGERASAGQHAMPWYILECIARVFQQERIRRALLVVKAESPMRRIVEGLRGKGVPAELLDYIGTETLAEQEGEGDKDGPRMVVCSEASVHGIDIRSLTHVFVAGAASNESIYRHIAGRVGRLGQTGRGTVITFVEGDAGERAKMGRILRRLGIEY